MQLLVDLGNTRFKWAVLDGDRLSPAQAVVHRGQDLAAILSAAWADGPVPSAVHLASVAAHDKRQLVEDWVRRHWACELREHVSGKSVLGLHNAYRDPVRLGVDRWLALVAAWQDFGQPICVVDCGSAVTVDILDGEGGHLGGWIVPGLQLMRQALQQGTPLAMAKGVADTAFGQDTETGIRNGTAQAIVGLIEQALSVSHLSPRLLLTGGDAAEVAHLLNREYEIRPDLVLEGLAAVLKGA